MALTAVSRSLFTFCFRSRSLEKNKVIPYRGGLNFLVFCSSKKAMYRGELKFLPLAVRHDFKLEKYSIKRCSSNVQVVLFCLSRNPGLFPPARLAQEQNRACTA